MISNDGHSTSGSAVHKKALSDLKTNQTSPRDKNGKNYVLQNNSTGPTKVFVASLDCLTNGWISLNHRHSIESNGCRSKIHCHSIYTVDHFPTIHSLTIWFYNKIIWGEYSNCHQTINRSKVLMIYSHHPYPAVPPCPPLMSLLLSLFRSFCLSASLSLSIHIRSS